LRRRIVQTVSAALARPVSQHRGNTQQSAAAAFPQVQLRPTGKEVTPPVNNCIELTVRVPRAILIQVVLVVLIIWTGYTHR
jgi:hypothetical protein